MWRPNTNTASATQTGSTEAAQARGEITTASMGKLAQRLHLGVRGELHVELEKATLLPGDRVVGAVRLVVSKPIQEASLILRGVGTQSLYWLTSSGESTYSHCQTADHWIEEIVLEPEETSFESGERAYAFAFQLPLDLQHNFSYTCRRIEELQAVRISVKYAVVVTLVVKGVVTANLESKAAFTVEPLPMAVPLGKPVTASETRDVKMFSVFKRGSCGVAMEMENDVFDSSSMIEALVVLHLETTRDLKYVLLSLYEDARFDKATFADHRTDSSSTALILRLSVTPNDVSEFDPLNPTMASHFLSLSYRVGVECKLSMAPRIKISVPVTIVRKLVGAAA